MKKHYYQAVVIVAGLASLSAGVLDDGRIDSSDLRVVGALVTLIGLGVLAWGRLAPSETAAYQLGHADGHRAGYEAGRRARPTVVTLTDHWSSIPADLP